MIVPISHVVILSLLLFGIGVVGIFTRRDAISVFLSVEILLNAANVAFIGFARYLGDETGQVAAFLVITVAAAEAAIGLAIVIRLQVEQGKLSLKGIRSLRE
ncbi:MAG: NADH-quinone oxidoreductase subunit NuoK [Pseudomonadota bacterium]